MGWQERLGAAAKALCAKADGWQRLLRGEGSEVTTRSPSIARQQEALQWSQHHSPRPSQRWLVLTASVGVQVLVGSGRLWVRTLGPRDVSNQGPSCH